VPSDSLLKIEPQASADAQVSLSSRTALSLNLHSVYHAQCFDQNGNLIWEASAPNIVVNEGANNLLQTFFTGSNYTAALYCGLISNTGFGSLQNSDTAAQITTSTPSGGTNQWEEDNQYGATRPTLSMGTASARSINNSSSKATFNFTGSDTIYGAFVVSASTVGGTSGFIYGEARFSDNTNRPVISGYTLTLSVTATA
jgi:hypothetical protein